MHSKELKNWLHQKELHFIEDLDHGLLSREGLRLSSMRVEKYNKIAKLLTKDTGFEWENQQTLIDEVAQMDNVDMNRVVTGTLDELNEEELQLLLDNEDLLKLRTKKLYPSSKERKWRAERKQIENKIGDNRNKSAKLSGSKKLRESDLVDIYGSKNEIERCINRVRRKLIDHIRYMSEIEKSHEKEQQLDIIQGQVSTVTNLLAKVLDYLDIEADEKKMYPIVFFKKIKWTN